MGVSPNENEQSETGTEEVKSSDLTSSVPSSECRCYPPGTKCANVSLHAAIVAFPPPGVCVDFATPQAQRNAPCPVFDGQLHLLHFRHHETRVRSRLSAASAPSKVCSAAFFYLVFWASCTAPSSRLGWPSGMASGAEASMLLLFSQGKVRRAPGR